MTPPYPSKDILIVCHAGTGLGLGHLTRSLVAARALRDKLNAEIYLIIQGNSVERADLLAFNHQFIAFEQDLGPTIKNINAIVNFNVVIFDLHPSYVPNDIINIIQILHVTKCKVVAIDGLLNYRAILDLIFIPAFHFIPPIDLADGAPIVFGWDCFLLNVQNKVTDWQAGHRVLALTGGSDATELGKTWPSLLDTTLPINSELHWVTGPFSQSPNWPVKPRIAIHNHLAPNGLFELMQRSNYAVTVFGVSFFELLYYGVPTVVFSPYGKKDNLELDAISKSGIALVANNEVEATVILVDLMKDQKLSREMSLRSRMRLSDSGTIKLNKEIIDLLEYS